MRHETERTHLRGYRERAFIMNFEQNERMNQLCLRISQEQDHAKFLQLVKELNDLLDEKEQRLEAIRRSEVMPEPRAQGA
jgi:hypothetical protein